MDTPQVGHQLKKLANRFYAVANDLLAMGPEAPSADTGRVGFMLDTLIADVDALADECARLRADHVDTQLARLGLDRQDQSGLKLHIGSGPHRLATWINIDFSPAELAMDVKWGLPFADGSARYVFLSHVLEHLFYDEAQRLLADIHRVLQPGGVVRIIVPDVEKCLRAYVEADEQFFADRRKTWWWWPQDRTRLQEVLLVAGVVPEPSAILDSHKYGYDFATLAALLRKVGFSAPARSGYLASAHAELHVDAHSLVAGATTGDSHYSLFVEAVR